MPGRGIEDDKCAGPGDELEGDNRRNKARIVVDPKHSLIHSYSIFQIAGWPCLLQAYLLLFGKMPTSKPRERVKHISSRSSTRTLTENDPRSPLTPLLNSTDSAFQPKIRLKSSHACSCSAICGMPGRKLGTSMRRAISASDWLSIGPGYRITLWHISATLGSRQPFRSKIHSFDPRGMA